MSADIENLVRLAFAAQAPLAAWGAELAEISPGRVVISTPISPGMTTTGTGVVMAGLVATIADVAAGLSLVSALTPPRPVTTVEMKIAMLAPARGARLECIGAVEKAGKSIAVVTAEAWAISAEGARTKAAILSATFVPAPAP
jgi:acyl-coenzyme A thioesterase PaaI-like protein